MPAGSEVASWTTLGPAVVATVMPPSTTASERVGVTLLLPVAEKDSALTVAPSAGRMVIVLTGVLLCSVCEP